MHYPLLTPLKCIPTPGGNVMHAMKTSDPGCQGFGEAYFSCVNKGAVKGWKRHQQMILNLIVPVGHIAFVIYDDREQSRYHQQFQRFNLGPHNYQRLTVPPGLWLAFCGIADEPNLLLNIANIPHDPLEADVAPLTQFAYDWMADPC